MNRAEAIWWVNHLFEIRKEEYFNKGMMEDAKEVDEAQHTVIEALQDDWIPVSERLPEVGSEVLVCFDFKCNRSVYISNFYGDGEFHGFDDEYLTPEGRKYRKAVAWRHLPAPYKESDNE